jgi:hypothetical protein
MSDLRLQTALPERADGPPAVRASWPSQVSVIRHELLTQDDFATRAASPSRYSPSKGTTPDVTQITATGSNVHQSLKADASRSRRLETSSSGANFEDHAALIGSHLSAHTKPV